MYIQLNGQIISYEKSGTGRPLILLHGNGEDHHIFDELVSTLTSDFTVYGIDTRGHGGSATPEEFHYINMTLDISRFITSLEIDRPILVGFSDGGIMALLLARLHSDMLGGIIVCGANRSPKGLKRSALREIKAHYKKTKSPLDKLMLEEPHITDEDLARIQVPALIMAGQDDLIKESETHAICDAIPHADLVILPGEDHGSYVLHSTELSDFIKNFAQTIPE